MFKTIEDECQVPCLAKNALRKKRSQRHSLIYYAPVRREYCISMQKDTGWQDTERQASPE